MAGKKRVYYCSSKFKYGISNSPESVLKLKQFI